IHHYTELIRGLYAPRAMVATTAGIARFVVTCEGQEQAARIHKTISELWAGELVPTGSTDTEPYIKRTLHEALEVWIAQHPTTVVSTYISPINLSAKTDHGEVLMTQMPHGGVQGEYNYTQNGGQMRYVGEFRDGVWYWTDGATFTPTTA